jgi:hypothetical protein
VPRSRSDSSVHRLAALAALLVIGGLSLVAPTAAGADTAPDDGSHPAELQPAPEDGQEQFGEPSDERTEELVRWLRTGLGVAVGVVILLLVIVVPLRLRNRQGPGDTVG